MTTSSDSILDSTQDPATGRGTTTISGAVQLLVGLVRATPMPRPAAFVLAQFFVIACATSHATTLARLDTRTLSRSSQEIVVGRVLETRAHWNPEHTQIVTDVEVEVGEVIKGSPSSHVTLSQLGGEVDGVRVTVPGCPVFRPGEEALLFVWRDRQGRAQLTGLGQGKFEIERDPSTGVAYVQRNLPGLEAGDVVELKSTTANAAGQRLLLDDLVREIRASIKTEKP